MDRRVSIPFAESNTNAQVVHGSPMKMPGPGPTETTLGKRHRDSGSSVVSSLIDAAEAGSPNANASTYSAGHPVVAACLFYNGSEEEGRANFKEFYDLGQGHSLCHRAALI